MTWPTSTVHLCPGCEAWQLDYTHEALLDAIGADFPDARAAARAANELVDAIILEHLYDCFGLPGGTGD